MFRSPEFAGPRPEVADMGWAELEDMVSSPGTITHLAHLERVSRDTVKFWKKVAVHGGVHESNFRDFGDTALSVNVTLADGSNPSLGKRGQFGNTYSIHSKSGEINNSALVVLSFSATERVAGSVDTADLENFFWSNHEKFKQEVFAEFLRKHGISYMPVGKDWEITLSPYHQAEFALYLNDCLCGGGSHKASLLAKSVADLSKINADMGYRFRGIYKEKGKLIWGDLPLLASDVSAIAEPIIPGKKYRVTKYPHHLSIQDVLG